MQVLIGNSHSETIALYLQFYNAVPSVFSFMFRKIIAMQSVLYRSVVDIDCPGAIKWVVTTATNRR